MKTYNAKKKITIAVLSFAAILLAVGLVVYVTTMGSNEPSSITARDTEDQDDVVEVKGIGTSDSAMQNTQENQEDIVKDTEQDAQGNITVADITPVIKSETSGQSKTSDDKPKTSADATTPATTSAVPKEEHDPAEAADSNEPPSTAAATEKAEDNTPQSGDKKDGAIYVPGFGWIKDEGGGVEVEEAPNAGTGEIVGGM